MVKYPIRIPTEPRRKSDHPVQWQLRQESRRKIQDYLNGQMRDAPKGTQREFSPGEIGSALNMKAEGVKEILRHLDYTANPITIYKE